MTGHRFNFKAPARRTSNGQESGNPLGRTTNQGAKIPSMRGPSRSPFIHQQGRLRATTSRLFLLTLHQALDAGPDASMSTALGSQRIDGT